MKWYRDIEHYPGRAVNVDRFVSIEVTRLPNGWFLRGYTDAESETPWELGGPYEDEAEATAVLLQIIAN